MRLAAVWGASGFVGRNLAAVLVDDGWQVRALVRSPELLPESIKSLVSDVRKLDFGSSDDEIVDALNDVEVVFHCAGDPSSDPVECQRYIDATKRLIYAAQNIGVGRLIHLSTVGVYGAQGRKTVDITNPLAGSTQYALSRIEAERVVLAADGGHAGLKATVVRIPMVIGEGMASNVLQRVYQKLFFGIFFHPGRSVAVLNCIGIRKLVAILAAVAEDDFGQSAVIQFGDNILWTDIVALMANESGRKITRMPIPLWMAKAIFFLLTGQSRGKELMVLANEVCFQQTDMKDLNISGELPETIWDIRKAIANAIKKS